MIIAINLTLVEFIAVPFAAIIFGVTIYYFIKSRQTLHNAMTALRRNAATAPRTEPAVTVSHKRSSLIEVEEQFAKMRFESAMAKQEAPLPVKRPSPITHADEDIAQEFKTIISQQQKILNDYLRQVEALESKGREVFRKENIELQKEITKLHGVIESKDREMEEAQQQAQAAKRMTVKIEEVYQEFDLLQTKMTALETQAGRANNLAIELQDSNHAHEQVHQELLRKQEKLEDIMNDNQRMRQQMNDLEDKLADANLQRQQLQKKVLFLTDLNTDMQSISDTNKKLQTELRRIGELESMLTMMAEERDFLLRKKTDK